MPVRFTWPVGRRYHRLVVRNHKKVVAIDDWVAYLGGIILQCPYVSEPSWRSLGRAHRRGVHEQEERWLERLSGLGMKLLQPMAPLVRERRPGPIPLATWGDGLAVPEPI